MMATSTVRRLVPLIDERVEDDDVTEVDREFGNPLRTCCNTIVRDASGETRCQSTLSGPIETRLALSALQMRRYPKRQKRGIGT